MATKHIYFAPIAELIELHNGMSILTNASPFGDLYGEIDGFDHDPSNPIFGENYIRD